MRSKKQPGNIQPAIRLPQVPPLKVAARRQFQRPTIIEPATEYTLRVPEPVTPRPWYPHQEEVTTIQPSIRRPVSPRMASRFVWEPTRHAGNFSISGGIPITNARPHPGRRQRRETSAGEIFLGCSILMLVGILCVALLYFLSSVM